MKKLFKKKCVKCGNTFETSLLNKIYCSDECQLGGVRDRALAFYYKKRAKIIKMETYPEYICQFCGKRVQLDFDPKKDDKKWDDYVCLKCKKKRSNYKLICWVKNYEENKFKIK